MPETSILTVIIKGGIFFINLVLASHINLLTIVWSPKKLKVTSYTLQLNSKLLLPALPDSMHYIKLNVDRKWGSHAG